MTFSFRSSLLFGFLLCTACTRQPELLAPGAKPLWTEPGTTIVESLTIVSANGPWSAKLEKRGGNHVGDSRWLISNVTTGIGSPSPLDRRANSTLLDHLTDALRLVKINQSQGRAETSALHEAGLSPPIYALQWTLRGLHDRELEEELQLGNLTPTKQGRFARFPALDPTRIYSVTGSFEGVLGTITSLGDLRARGWADFSADDVDEIVVSGAGISFYAQRDGDHWADRLHHAFIGPDALLLAALNEPITYIDDPATSRGGLNILGARADIRIEFRGRNKRLGQLRLKRTPSDLPQISTPWIAADFSTESSPGLTFGLSSHLAAVAQTVKLPALPN